MPAMCARAVATVLSMVQREVTNAARPPGFSRSIAARDEVVVQGQAELAGRVVRPHRAVAEGRVADRQVEALGQPRLGEVLGPDPGLGDTAAGRSAR